MSTLQFDKCGETLVIVHAAVAPTDEEWDAWIARMAHQDYKRVLILSRGGGPNARQRRKTNKFWAGRDVPRFALVTTSRFVIGIIKAFNWFLDDQLKPFHPDRMDEALDYIEVPEPERAALRARADVLTRQLESEAA
jgi:hypothetical protein